jgi:hypothetical protein
MTTEAWVYMVFGAFVLGGVLAHRFLPPRIDPRAHPELTPINAVSVYEYNGLRLLRELREALDSHDFLHWRIPGRQMWIVRIDAVLSGRSFRQA